MSHLDVAVVGYGVMGKHHADIYAALPYTNLVAVVDPDPGCRRDAERQYAVNSYRDLASLLERHPLDAVSVAAPTSVHYPLCQALLEAGVHVLVEKPVAAQVRQAEHLASLSRQRGLVLQVGHITRFYRAISMLQERVSAPYLIDARRLTPHARIKDVGVILDLMIHDIDIVLGIIPNRVEDITVAGQALNGSPYEDVAAAQIVFEGGCIARFLASRVAPDPERTLLVAEAHQALRLDFGKDPHTEIAVFAPLSEGSQSSHVHVDRLSVHEENPLRKEIEHFLARIRQDAAPIGTLEDDLRSLKLANELIKRLEPSCELV